jgi:hypothetical protein
MKIKRPLDFPLPKKTLKLDNYPFSSLNFFIFLFLAWALKRCEWLPNYESHEIYI